ncbi:hypothetical protein OLMES_3498 [Oleiphilus messinensis]|uniref:Uncharacterized protein n=1 Tax=Oleiphilus messinensis TaxID=141451 RepID=A0A1Y0IDR9_9GAMM|nr:hypothetical protein [Oleiphilus messinensis]ARU57533.1 hypothetical protein OLMES_3498 [Oleiphilus messinensis]
MMRKVLVSSVIAVCLSVPGLHAELKAMDDSELASVSGKAMFSIDQYDHPDPLKNTSYTRINLGLDVETVLNADVLELGRYERAGEKAGSSDVLINNFGLGGIYSDAYYQNNPQSPRPLKADGSQYQEGELVPFTMHDPFIEFSFDETTGQPTGVRIGFGDSKGFLSGDIQTLTGNINVEILDRGQGLQEASSNGNLFDQIVIALAPYLAGGSPIRTEAQLVDMNGNLDPIRAEYAGVPDGEKFVIEDVSGATRWLINTVSPLNSSNINNPNCSFFWCPAGDIEITVEDCLVLGITACFDLGNFKSLPVGQIEEIDGKRYLTDSVPGVFISLQSQDVDWLVDTAKLAPNPEDFLRATQGAFLNVPNSAVQFNLNEALNGISRVRTEYIDRGVGLF